jgi:hypothetical protein
VSAHFRDGAAHAEMWDAFTGAVTGLTDPAKIDLDLAPYESRLIFFSKDAKGGAPEPETRETVVADLSQAWAVRFGETDIETKMDRLRSWSDDAKTQFFSGTAVYEREFEIGPDQVKSSAKLFLDFGQAKPEPIPSPAPPPNMRAYLDPPVREAAEVFVNGKSAGFVWRPPYRLDITAPARAGTNHLRIVVGNTAINELAGQALPDCRLLDARYGVRFAPQGMDDLKPLPSGLLGPVTLVEAR